MALVSLTQCPDYDQQHVDAAIQKTMGHLGGIERFVKSDDRVLLKVNLLLGALPERAVTTHPSIMRAMIHQVRAAGGIPTVGDCSGFEGPSNAGRFHSACRRAGFRQVCDEEGVELVHLSADSVEVENPEGRAFKRFGLARWAVDADVLISLPKLKTHGLTLFTGGVKNLFGCLPGLQKGEMHLRAPKSEAFSQMLVDLLVAVRPDLTVMDAVVGMEGNGPSNGEPRKIGAVLASTDPVALDCVACRIVGVDPMDVATTRLATAQGKGEGDPRRIEVAGDRIERVRVEGFRLPSGHGGIFRTAWLISFLQGRLVAKPAVVAELCQGCWTCEEHCPAGAISRNGRLPVFDYGKCIRCYCCQEMCLHDAIALRRPLLSRLLAR